jgi:hypothetical protein
VLVGCKDQTPRDRSHGDVEQRSHVQDALQLGSGLSARWSGAALDDLREQLRPFVFVDEGEEQLDIPVRDLRRAQQIGEEEIGAAATIEAHLLARAIAVLERHHRVLGDRAKLFAHPPRRILRRAAATPSQSSRELAQS